MSPTPLLFNDEALRALVVSAEVAALVVDRALGLRCCTPRAAALLGLGAGASPTLPALVRHIDCAALADDAALACQALPAPERVVAGRDGRWYAAQARPCRDAEGQIDGAVLSFVDISGRHRAEDTLRLMAGRDGFLEALVHELKNPLNLIQLNAELLTRVPELRAAPAVQRAAEMIRRSVLGQAQAIDDLLDLARFDHGDLALERRDVDAAAVARALAGLRADEAAAKGVELVLELADEPLLLHADPVRVEQIVWNLLANALKHTPAGGRVTLRWRRDRAAARLDVEDTGCGLSEDALSHVFAACGSPEPARRHGGLRIGLALVKRLAEAHGGQVQARSAGPDRGACFSVWLPLAQPA